MLKRQLVLHGTQATGWLLLLAAVALVAVVCIWLLYRYERRLISRRLGFLLLALRVLAVLVVFVVLLEPVVAWTWDRERTGRVIVAVDVSQSMETTDKHASPAEKLRWARALGMIGNDAFNDRLDRWIEAWENGQEPEWVEPNETADPDRRRALAESRRENVAGILKEIDRLPRTEIARRLLTGGSTPLLKQFDELAVVDLRVFAGASSQTDAASLEKTLAEPPRSVRVDASDLSQAVAAGTQAGDDARLAGVIMLSDGRDNAHAEGAGAPLMARVQAIGAPVYPVLLGSQQRPRDIAIGTLDYPATVFQEDHALLKATLRTAGFDGQPLTMHLEREDDPAAPPQTKTVTPDGHTASVEFELDAATLGRRRYVLRTDVQPGETRNDNNNRPFSFHVVDDEADVLVLEGEARWEFRYLNDALSRDEHIRLEKVVFRQPYLGVLPDTFFPRTLALPPAAQAVSESPFSKFDAVIIGDVAPFHLPDGGWELLDKYVREEGGTLILTAGKRHFPLAYRSRVVDDLLPVADLGVVAMKGPEQTGIPADRGFRLQLTPDGEAQPTMQFDTDPVENRRIWSHLPGHSWGLRGKAKGGASVWASVIDAGLPPAGRVANPPHSLQAERDNAVVVHQYLGAGQVLWIGVDSTWRWRFLVGDKHHHRFWGQLARWAAEFKATAGNEFVRFGPERPTIDAGDDALLRARWSEHFLRRFPKLKARAEFFKPEGDTPVMTVDLTPLETRPLIHEGRALGLDSGEYRVRLMVDNADLGAGDISAELVVAERVTTELSDVSANRDLLEQMADATGGKLYFPDQLAELPKLFEGTTETTTHREEIALWDHWLTLLVFCGVLVSEWVLRKLNGLP